MSGTDGGREYVWGWLAMPMTRAALTASAQGCNRAFSWVLRHAVWVPVAIRCNCSFCKNLHVRFGCYTTMRKQVLA